VEQSVENEKKFVDSDKMAVVCYVHPRLRCAILR